MEGSLIFTMHEISGLDERNTSSTSEVSKGISAGEVDDEEYARMMARLDELEKEEEQEEQEEVVEEEGSEEDENDTSDEDLDVKKRY